MAKVTGASRYIDDLAFPGMLHGTTIRSTIPCGEIASIRADFDPAGFVVADYRDIPGRNVVALIEEDQPLLAEREIRHVAEPILLAAHEDKERLLDARYSIEYRAAEPVFDSATSPKTFKRITIEKGEIARGFEQADRIIEGSYRCGHQEQLYIECNGVIAVPENGVMTVYGSLQCPYYVHRALAVILGLPPEKVRVVQTETGGGFGGKEEYPSMIAGHAAVLAWKARRPVKIVYDRVEDMLATTKRHPGVIRHRTGVAKDGRLTAMEIDVLLDGGAYCTLSPATATGQVLGRDASARAVLREAVSRTDFRSKRRAYAGSDRGIGLSLFFHGSGFTGGGEVKLASKASLELTDRGARILVASTEIGQGTRTMHAQIVADALGVPYDAIEVSDADTARVPDSGPTVASRTCMIVGKILENCASEMKRRLAGLSPREYRRQHGPLVVTREYERPAELAWDDETYRGDAYGAYGWGCNVAEIEIDRVTGAVRPLRLTAVCEIGKAIHPVLAAGQIEGGTAQGIGYALLEEVVMKDGRMANAQMTNYVAPTTLDTPPLDIVILESPYRHGPHGAKGVGEMPIDGPAPAIVNAIRHLGIDARQIPATPERILESESTVDSRQSTEGSR